MKNEIIGWMGTTFLSTASIPQVYKVLKEGHAEGLSWLYVILILFGLICMSFYANSNNSGMSLEVSYSVQFILFLVIVIRKFFPTKDKR
jgi:uncharacterized protein with PQ loop repeat